MTVPAGRVMRHTLCRNIAGMQRLLVIVVKISWVGLRRMAACGESVSMASHEVCRL